MADLNQDDQVECPLCMEPLEVDDLTFFPCSCGYQICRFCWHRIRTDENELCPACRKAYSENPADFKPLSQEQIAALKAEKRQRDQQKKQKVNEDRKHLANVRVVQKNLVFVVGLPPRLADPEVLKRHEYFGKYGKIHKVVINPSTAYAGAQGPSASAYVTYVANCDALKAIQSVNNITIDARLIKTSLGTTKYCSNFMKNQPCPKPDCMYLHELGDEEASFTKEEMHQGKHQEYEKKLHDTLISQQLQEERDREKEKERDREQTSNGSGNGGSGKSESSSDRRNGHTSNGNGVSESKREKREREREKRESSSSNGGNGGSSKRNKDTWPSLTTSPTPKGAQKSAKDSKGEGKDKSSREKSRSGREREKKASPVTTVTEEQEPVTKTSESSSDSGYQNEREKSDDTDNLLSGLPETTTLEDAKTSGGDMRGFFDNSDSTNSNDTPFTNISEQQAKGLITSTINSHLPDLLNGTGVDRSGGYFGATFDQAIFGKHNGDGFVDWDDKVMFQPFNKLKLDEAFQRDENSLLDKHLLDQKADAKANCTSNMLKFFDFHKNLQNQYYQQKSGFPMAPAEKSYSIFSDYNSKPMEVEKQQRMPNGAANFGVPHPAEQHYQQQQQQQQQAQTNKHNSLLNSMYQIQQPTVADELGFDPFTETQKALEELIKDEVNRKKTENGDMAAKRNALNAPPGFSQINTAPSPRSLLPNQATWNGFNNQAHQNHNLMGMNKAPGHVNGGDWTTFDPAIVSYRQFPSQQHNYGSNGLDHTGGMGDPRGNMGMPNPAPNINDFHFNMHQQPSLNFPFDSNGSYGLFASHAAVQSRNNPMVNPAATNWYNNHPSNGGYGQNSASSLEKLIISMPPGFPANMNGNRNN